MALSLAVTACGGDDDGDGAGGSGGSAAGSGGSGGSATGGSGGSTTGGSGGGGVIDPADCPAATPYLSGGSCIDEATAVSTCKTAASEARPGTNVDDPTCGAGCTCTSCTQEMLDCGEDPEAYCEVIVACANEKGCTGVACYAPETCQTVIDEAPGGGLSSLSLALASAISDCAEANTCAASCN